MSGTYIGFYVTVGDSDIKLDISNITKKGMDANGLIIPEGDNDIKLVPLYIPELKKTVFAILAMMTKVVDSSVFQSRQMYIVFEMGNSPFGSYQFIGIPIIGAKFTGSVKNDDK